MTLSKTQYAIVCGAIDGSLFVFSVLLFIFFSGDVDGLQKLFTSHWQYLIFGLMPFGLLIAWRGRKDAQRLLTGNLSLLLAPAEGFGWGFGLSMSLWVAGFVSEVFAAGGNFDEVIAQPTSLKVWWNVLSVLVPLSAVIGLMGGLVAFLIHLLNRYLVELWKVKVRQ